MLSNNQESLDLKASTKWLIFITVLLVYLTLAAIDKDTHSINDIVNARMVPAFFFYCIPGYFVCKFFVRHFSKEEKLPAMLKPLFAGVIVSFLSVMGLLVLLKEVGVIPSE